MGGKLLHFCGCFSARDSKREHAMFEPAWHGHRVRGWTVSGWGDGPGPTTPLPCSNENVMQHCMAQHSPADGVLPRKPAACYFTVTVASPVISNPPKSQAPKGKPTTAMGCEPLDELVIQHCLRAIGAWWHPDGSQVLASNVTHQSTLLFLCKPCCCEPGSTEYFIK